MRRLFALVVLLGSMAWVVAGCGCGHSNDGGDGIKAEVPREMQEANDLAQKVKGDWKKLTPVEQEKMVKQFGSKDTAKVMLKNMFSPPNAKYLKK
jgi:hypothetical protein